MAVSAESRVRFLPFAQFGAPFPAGIWIGSTFGVGDASGGDIVLHMEINLLTEPFSAQIFTLEQIELQPTDASVHSYLLEATGFTTVGVASRFPHIALLANSNQGGPAALYTDNLLQRPYYLGQADRSAGIDTEITVRTDNVNGETYICNLLGYYWEPAAVNARGGPQRPPGALFGN